MTYFRAVIFVITHDAAIRFHTTYDVYTSNVLLYVIQPSGFILGIICRCITCRPMYVITCDAAIRIHTRYDV